MLILLPPSETKLAGGTGAPLDLSALGFPELNPVRLELLDACAALADDLPAARVALGVAAAKDAEIGWNAVLRTSGTMAALDRYTGVLYDNLAARTLTKVQRARAEQRLLLTSSLFGQLRATDPIPSYRLSAGSKLPGRATLASGWRPVLSPALAGLDDLVLDLRSGAYATFAPLPSAISVSVLSENGSGDRSVVSHFSKATKGLLARALCISRAELTTVSAVVRATRTAGFRVERTGDRALVLIS